ncbi:MAG: hypothetical protein OXI40_14605 [Chloroflexota bacterium]|nr:hypothetical protein [Chloroflexota bacterium]
MFTIRDCEVLREAYSPHSELAVDEAWRRIGSPTSDDLIAYACEQMSNPDRNVRVLMLRLLARQTGARGTGRTYGIVRQKAAGLHGRDSSLSQLSAQRGHRASIGVDSD